MHVELPVFSPRVSYFFLSIAVCAHSITNFEEGITLKMLKFAQVI
jgi:hypothetical protein